MLVFNLKDNYELTKLYRDDVSYKKILKTTKDASVFRVNSLSVFFALEGDEQFGWN